MYIRRTHTNNSSTGERYYTYRLVANQRVNGKPRQITLLNLGRHFAVDQDHWPALCARIDELISHQVSLVSVEFPPAEEQEAQRIAALLIERQAQVEPVATEVGAEPNAPKAKPADLQSVDVDSLELSRPRSVGVEQVGLWAMQQLGFQALLSGLGMNEKMISVCIGQIIARMAAPSSELFTHGWLGSKSGLGELLDFDYQTLPLMTLYRASDLLWKHHTMIEQRLFDRVTDLFGLSTTVTLYDLTNTYFEGEVPTNRKARRGRSKEKRSDCPLVTLGRVLDGSGFVRSSQTFSGNVSEPVTLETMLKGLDAPKGALVVMDAGIASQDNIDWLIAGGYRYIVVSRERARQFDLDQAVGLTTASGDIVHCQKVLAEDGKEVRLYCHSEARGQKEQAMTDTFSTRFEAALKNLNEGLQRQRTEKRPNKLWERIGRLKAKHNGIGQHYAISLQLDESGEKAIGLTLTKTPITGTMLTHPGVNCLRSNETHLGCG